MRLINSDGKNLTEEYTDKYINAKKAIMAYKGIDQVKWVTQGSDKAVHKMYVFWDPNCIYCHMLYKVLQPFIADKELQVRWVPVAIRPNSLGKTAQVFHAKNDKAALAEMMKDESHFDMRTEQGSLKALPKNKDTKPAYDKANANTKYFLQYFNATPVMLFQDAKGKPSVVPGYVSGAQLKALIDSTAKTW